MNVCFLAGFSCSMEFSICAEISKSQKHKYFLRKLMELKGGFHKTSRIHWNHGGCWFSLQFHGIRRCYVDSEKLCGILGKCKIPSPRATGLRQSAKTFEALRKYIPFGGVDSHRNYWNRNGSLKIVCTDHLFSIFPPTRGQNTITYFIHLMVKL